MDLITMTLVGAAVLAAIAGGHVLARINQWVSDMKHETALMKGGK